LRQVIPLSKTVDIGAQAFSCLLSQLTEALLIAELGPPYQFDLTQLLIHTGILLSLN
jgi:hypothetical protein